MSAPRRASLSSVATSGAWQMSRNSGTRRASRNTCRARFRSHKPVPAQEEALLDVVRSCAVHTTVEK